MPEHRRPMIRIAINYELLVAETIGQVTNAQLGLWLRGLAWTNNSGRDWVPRGVLGAYSDDGDDYRADAQALIDAGLFEEHPDHPGSYQLGHLGWLLTVPVRRSIPARVRAEVLGRDEHRCRRCPATSGLTIDHIKPVSRGGTDDLTNLQTLCQPCNSSKGARV